MNLTPQDIQLTLELIKLAPINGGAAVQVALLQQKYQQMLNATPAAVEAEPSAEPLPSKTIKNEKSNS